MEPNTFTTCERRLVEVCRLLAQEGFDVGRPTPLRTTLLDTYDGRLHAAGLRLEVREGRRRELVLSGGGPVVAMLAVDGTPSLAADLPPGPFRDRLAAVLEVRALLPVLAMAGRRSVAVRRDGAGKVRVGVTLHHGVSVDWPKVAPATWAAEVEELEGYPDAARRARGLLRSFELEEHGGGDLVDLLARGAGVDLRGRRTSPTIALERGEPAIHAFRKVLANLADAVEANRAGTVDDIDPEFLHDLRVAVRRARSVLSEAKGILPDEVRDRFRRGFGWLGGVTTPTRDLDVYLIEWDGYTGPLRPDAAATLEPIVRHIARRRQAAHAELAAALQSDHYHEFTTSLTTWLDEPLPADGGGGKALSRIGPVVGRRIAVTQARLLKRGRAIGPGAPAEELHALRKDAKRLRYLLECFGGLLPPAPRKTFVKRLKSLQDNLGEHQDTEVHAIQLRTFSQELFEATSATAETLVSMGQVAERLENRRQAARAEFAQRFADYDTKGTAQALEGLLRAASGR